MNTGDHWVEGQRKTTLATVVTFVAAKATRYYRGVDAGKLSHTTAHDQPVWQFLRPDRSRGTREARRDLEERSEFQTLSIQRCQCTFQGPRRRRPTLRR